MDTVLIHAVAHAQPEDLDLCIGRPLEITPPPPSDRLHPGQPDSAKLGIGRLVAFQSPPLLWKDTPKPRENPLVEDVGKQMASAKKLARAKEELQRIHESSKFRATTLTALVKRALSYRKLGNGCQLSTPKFTVEK